MGGVQSTSSVALPRSVAVEMPNQVLAHATSIDLTAAIDPTTVADSAYGSTVYLTSTVVVPAAPTASGPPHFVFSYGDSYTANGFNIHGNKPSLENNEGNAIGTTAGGNSQPNWIEILVNNGPVNSLSYDFAYGGAAVDNKLTKGVNHIIPDFVSQSQSFLQNLAMTPHPSWAQWSGNNSLFVTWFGRNDVYWQIIQGDPVSPRLDNVIRAYFDILTGLYASGARKFLVLGIPPFWREPIWKSFPQYAPKIQPAADYWDTAFQKVLATWKTAHPLASVTYFDPQPIFNNFLDNPTAVGAPNNYCSNHKNTYPGNGTNCLWSDLVHPSEGISAAVGYAVSDLLAKEGVFGSSSATTPQDPSGTSGAQATSSKPSSASSLRSLHVAWSDMPLSTVVAILAMVAFFA